MATPRPEPSVPPTLAPPAGLALVLGGGGARGAYQAGVLRGIARRRPELSFPILAGISAGAVNTIHVASHTGTFAAAADDLVKLWLSLSPDQVFDMHARTLLNNVFAWGARLISGGMHAGREPMRGMVDTEPLRRFLNTVLEPASDGTLPGIAGNIARGACMQWHSRQRATRQASR